MLPDNELEALTRLHVEDIDCSLTVRPTRTAFDLTFFEEVCVCWAELCCIFRYSATKHWVYFVLRSCAHERRLQNPSMQ